MKAKFILTVLLALATATAFSPVYADDMMAAQQADNGGGMSSQQQSNEDMAAAQREGEAAGMVCQGCH